jgi:hypothetical protein
MKYPKEIYTIAKKAKLSNKEIEAKYAQAVKEAKAMGMEKNAEFVLETLKALINYKDLRTSF